MFEENQTAEELAFRKPSREAGIETADEASGNAETRFLVYEAAPLRKTLGIVQEIVDRQETIAEAEATTPAVLAPAENGCRGDVARNSLTRPDECRENRCEEAGCKS